MMQHTSLRKENFVSYLLIGLIVSAIALSVMPTVASAETPAGYVYSSDWGTQNLNRPVCIAIDGSGSIYITDELDRIQKFSSTGALLGGWGISGQDDGQFNTPKGVAIDSTGNIYVVDSNNHRVQKFSANGEFLTKWGSRGSDYRQFSYPTGIAIDSQGNVYVADKDNDRIQKFTSEGVFITGWGSEGKGYGQFNSPTGLAIDKNDKVYVDDYSNNRIQKFDAEGNYISSWGDFFISQWVAVDKDTNVYVSDYEEVSKFTSEGTFLTKWGNYGSGEGQLSQPAGMAISKSGAVFVVDSWNNRVEVFSPIGILDVPSGSGNSTTNNSNGLIGSFDNIIILFAGPAIVVISVIAIYFVVKVKIRPSFPQRLRSSKSLIVITGICCAILPIGFAAFSVIPWNIGGTLATVSIGIATLLLRLLEIEKREKEIT
jgi:DNA-binding beta-propeller fold protein YncE